MTGSEDETHISFGFKKLFQYISIYSYFPIKKLGELSGNKFQNLVLDKAEIWIFSISNPFIPLEQEHG